MNGRWYVALFARSTKLLRYLMFLVNETKGKPAAIFECMNAFRDLKVRKAVPFPRGIVERIDPWLDRDQKLDWTAGLWCDASLNGRL
jgi:hypothetical protein